MLWCPTHRWANWRLGASEEPVDELFASSVGLGQDRNAPLASPRFILVVLAEGVHVDLRDDPGVLLVADVAQEWPVAERYNLTAQLRRAATSVPLNIAEGLGCSTDAECARFVGDAYRSLQEVVPGLELCQRLSPALPVPPVTVLIDEGNQISRMAHRLIQRLGTSTEPRAG